MSWIEALILGIIQGLTEFLPVSSSGHLEIGSVLLDAQSSDNLLFAVVVHLATALATIAVFKNDILELLKDILKFQWNESTQFATKILISMVPVFVVAVFFKDQIEALFIGNLALVGSMLLVTGGLLLFAHFKKDGDRSVGFLGAMVIGLAQAFAVLPGISRSGSTIATALILGVERSKAARFSFLMVLIPILGASLLELLDYSENPTAHSIDLISLIVGFVAAFIAGFVACKWMIKIVRKGKLTYFAAYCFVVGLIAIVAS
ncbi:undecaprenyl-diphosphatase [Ekhidna lutea]|uniref:Undecaprenyl-diphosphatase n=1 Tax=Ekhidna lutea TaxID=447679 RepID=A0A239LAA6_EKHLU|nr:undecaprenyl-diphosphate phosphatase [Ekhidna lutea]SNT26474.1 undecaprenyl-diphosphatase [Ekhidna lutea]